MIKGEQSSHVDRLLAEREPFVLATVVRARRPTSVRPGNAAVVLPDGTIDGFVGGVCAVIIGAPLLAARAGDRRAAAAAPGSR